MQCQFGRTYPAFFSLNVSKRSLQVAPVLEKGQ